jgi:predicted nucleic acid-binding protein
VKYLLDTSVYIEGARSEPGRVRFRSAFSPLLLATFLSAVVAYELQASAADGRTAALVRDFTRPMERTGRVVSPTFDDWMMAAEVVTGIRQKDRGWRSKLPALLNDILIALCARRIGALMITHNREDFRLIRRHVGFSLRVLEPAGDG